MVEDRLTSQYPNRLRRLIDRIRATISSHESRLDDLDEMSLPSTDFAYFDINSSGETIAIPSGAGEVLIRVANTFTAGTHQLTFQTNNVLVSTGTTYATMSCAATGAVMYCISVYHANVWRWYALHYQGWSNP